MESTPRLFENEVDTLQGLAPWLGGKRALARRVIREILRIPHKAYAEPFIGMGGIFLRRPQRAQAEIINDASGDVVNLFRLAQRHPNALAEELGGMLMSRAEFARLAKLDPEQLTDIERAARFLLLQYAGFGGKATGRTFGVDPSSSARFQPGRVKKLLQRVHARLEGVVIENLDAGAFLDRYDRPYTLFYLDPPYIGCEDDYGAELFSAADHRRIADHLVGLQGAFVLSINDCHQARELFGGFRLIEVELSYTINPQSAGVRRQELIVSNR
ncbi:DNA adenine methylase [Thalassobaculum litoreum]|uniref:site-specific DNA-methyltransferase (adenine-specific) n=1 Tax=Thalassobaculum litoreum DSM 18839 TaxID=1123362 RepID=A0A8G2EY53_9PROT|nr:DNA adenine methylase [Thalassobaculum litoreum]SDF46191.1 DNA adenine methylase [Thalassobaculum litoreum DSM 18839]